jgi:hypothetical protein
MPPANPPPADDATPTEQPTPGAGGAGDVGELKASERKLMAVMAVAARNAGFVEHAGWLDRVLNTIDRAEAERDALRAAVELVRSERGSMSKAAFEKFNVIVEGSRAALARGPAADGQGNAGASARGSK